MDQFLKKRCTSDLLTQSNFLRMESCSSMALDLHRFLGRGYRMILYSCKNILLLNIQLNTLVVQVRIFSIVVLRKEKTCIRAEPGPPLDTATGHRRKDGKKKHWKQEAITSLVDTRLSLCFCVYGPHRATCHKMRRKNPTKTTPAPIYDRLMIFLFDRKM